jgi:hypothetical protein
MKWLVVYGGIYYSPCCVTGNCPNFFKNNAKAVPNHGVGAVGISSSSSGEWVAGQCREIFLFVLVRLCGYFTCRGTYVAYAHRLQGVNATTAVVRDATCVPEGIL